MSELYHYGMPQRSGRYPYGSGERPYQGEEKSKKISRKEQRQQRKVEKRRAEILEKARKAAAEKRRIEKEAAERKQKLEADKERVLREGSATELLKYQGLLTNNELQQALNRVKWTEELKAISAKETKSGFDKIDDVMKKVGQVTGWVNTGSEVASTINKMVSAIDKATKDDSAKRAKTQQERRKQDVKKNTTIDSILKNADVLTGAEVADLKKKVDTLDALRRQRAGR